MLFKEQCQHSNRYTLHYKVIKIIKGYYRHYRKRTADYSGINYKSSCGYLLDLKTLEYDLMF